MSTLVRDHIKYVYRGNEICFKHTANRSISFFTKEVSIVKQALKPVRRI